ncbi:MAG: RNA 2',3'-cyclic phosphodiesterase [Candidatus Micrarchaeia archaeon]|jgi:2'-5' RNA ligase
MRCFVALEFDEKAGDFLANLALELSGLGIGAAVVSRENMHLTLCFLGEITEKQAQAAAQSVSGLSFSPFPVELAGIGFFPSENFIRVAWVGAESEGGIEALHEKVHSLVAKGTQAEKERERFSAHITLARVKSPKNADALRQWAQKKNAEGVSLQCTATRVALKQTTFRPEGGVAYSDLASSP